MKKCTRCKQIKELSAFSQSSHRCKPCQNINGKEWYYRQKDLNPLLFHIVRLEKRTRAQSRKRAIFYNLDVDYLVSIACTHCPALGVELIYAGKGVSSATASLDRFNPKLGYIKGNVHFISYRANEIKHLASTSDQMFKVAE